MRGRGTFRGPLDATGHAAEAGDDGDLIYGGGEIYFGTQATPSNFTWTPNA